MTHRWLLISQRGQLSDLPQMEKKSFVRLALKL